MSQNKVFSLVENFEFEQLQKYSVSQKQDFDKEIIEINSQKRNIIHIGCIAGVPQTIEFLVESINRIKGNSLEFINAKDQESYTPLHYCIQSCDDGMPEIVQLLIENHVEINTQTNTGETALHMSSNIGQEDVVKALIKSPETNINIQNNLGETPLMQSIQEGQFHIFNILMERKDLDINIRDRYGYNCVHHAAITKGNSPVYLRALANSSVDLNSLDNENNTPILQAAQQDYKKFYRAIETLAQLNVNLEHQNNNGLELKDFIIVEDQSEKNNEYYSILYSIFLGKGYDLSQPKKEGQQKQEIKQEQQEEQKEQEKPKGEWEIKGDELEKEKQQLQQKLKQEKERQLKLQYQKFDQKDTMLLAVIIPLIFTALYLSVIRFL